MFIKTYLGSFKFKLHTCTTITVAEVQSLISERNTLQQLLAKFVHPSGFVLLLPKTVTSLSKKCSVFVPQGRWDSCVISCSVHGRLLASMYVDAAQCGYEASGSLSQGILPHF